MILTIREQDYWIFEPYDNPQTKHCGLSDQKRVLGCPKVYRVSGSGSRYNICETESSGRLLVIILGFVIPLQNQKRNMYRNPVVQETIMVTLKDPYRKP